MIKRNTTIDTIKCFATLLITNSHMEVLYGKYSILATGGAIGDVLFFFCSGFTLIISKMSRFDNWYKRRINRIYPTIFAWAILSAFIFNQHYSIYQIIIYSGGWFIRCIMIYYVILYLIQRFMINRLHMIFTIVSIITILWYFIIDKSESYNMYGNTYFKWCHYFLFMLLGAIISLSEKKYRKNLRYDTLKLVGSIMIYYILLYLRTLHHFFSEIQIITLIPLLFIVYYFYKVCDTYVIKELYNNQYIKWCIKFISSLCLEIYIVQYTIITYKINIIFPLNLFVMYIAIIIIAYFLRCSTIFLSQTFNNLNYDWKAIVKI